MTTPNSQYKTLGNIRSAIVQDSKESSQTNMITLINRWINEGYEQVVFRKKRDWLDQQLTVQVNAAVQATCTVTNNSKTVTFTGGTTFASGVELNFINNGFQEIYSVSSSTSNVITLTNPYLGTTNTAAAGIVYQPSVILDASVRHLYQAYHQYGDRPLTDIGPQQMRSLQEAQNVQLDYASFFTLFGQDSTGARRLLLFPYPLVSYTLNLDVNTFVTQLTSDTDQPLIPMQYRQVLYWYALWKLWKYHRNEEQAAGAYAFFNKMLGEMDAEMRGEIEFPQLTVNYTKGPSLRSFAPPFNPLLRNS